MISDGVVRCGGVSSRGARVQRELAIVCETRTERHPFRPPSSGCDLRTLDHLSSPRPAAHVWPGASLIRRPSHEATDASRAEVDRSQWRHVLGVAVHSGSSRSHRACDDSRLSGTVSFIIIFINKAYVSPDMFHGLCAPEDLCNAAYYVEEIYLQ